MGAGPLRAKVSSVRAAAAARETNVNKQWRNGLDAARHAHEGTRIERELVDAALKVRRALYRQRRKSCLIEYILFCCARVTDGCEPRVSRLCTQAVT